MKKKTKGKSDSKDSSVIYIDSSMDEDEDLGDEALAGDTTNEEKI